MARQAGLEPTTLGLEGRGAIPPTVIRPSQTPVTLEAPAAGTFQPPHPSPGSTKVFAASLLQGAASGPGARLLTVREVAARLSVCTATVYSLCSRGLLRFIRVSGALRIDPASVEAFIAAGGSIPSQG
ncbi:MAG TPA: helix-turn-helix domain-containing protein [Myxococcaceae bacterium]|nr:helix-turn-helix domain-containing protein [Myxococcaceae bacterium]